MRAIGVYLLLLCATPVVAQTQPQPAPSASYELLREMYALLTLTPHGMRIEEVLIAPCQALGRHAEKCATLGESIVQNTHKLGTSLLAAETAIRDRRSVEERQFLLEGAEQVRQLTREYKEWMELMHPMQQDAPHPERRT